jgi:phage baseplate assembly protein W
MAIILGTRLVKDTETYNDYAIGITLPIQISNTAFNQSFTTIEQLSSNIKNLLLTKRGERLMHPDFGSGLQEILFEPETDEIETKIEEAIIGSMGKWLPYVNIEQIDIDTSDSLKDANTVNVSLTFSIAGASELNTVTFNVSAG